MKDIVTVAEEKVAPPPPPTQYPRTRQPTHTLAALNLEREREVPKEMTKQFKLSDETVPREREKEEWRAEERRAGK